MSRSLRQSHPRPRRAPGAGSGGPGAEDGRPRTCLGEDQEDDPASPAWAGQFDERRTRSLQQARHGPQRKIAGHAGYALPAQALALGEGAPPRRQIGTHMIVLNLVLIGLAITLEPIPLTAFILVLASKGGVRKGAAFIFGWLVSLAIVIAFRVPSPTTSLRNPVRLPPWQPWPPSSPWARSRTTGSWASRNRRKSPPAGRRTSTI